MKTKTLSLLLAPAFALMAISVNGQNLTPGPMIKTMLQPMPQGQHLKYYRSTHKISASATNGLIDYLDGDYEYGGYSSSNWANWGPPLYLNMRYTINDTAAAGSGHKNFNTYTANYATITYDTIWDQYAYQNGNPGFVGAPVAGSVSVDTIVLGFYYRNTSGANDTIKINVCGVTKNGLPATSPVYGSMTKIIAPHNHDSLPGTSLDSLWGISLIASSPINIPGSARHGWNFCINIQVYGSKLDTLGLDYQGGLSVCSNGGNPFNIASPGTTMGGSDGKILSVNSWVTGLYAYNSTSLHGTGKQMTWPNPGTGVCDNGYYTWYPLWYDGLPGGSNDGCTDTTYFPIQNLNVLAGIIYTLAPAGINTINPNGLSVGQNYPNPFNGTTEITYNVKTSSSVDFNVYDVTGRTIISNKYTDVVPGEHTISISSSQLSSGIYFYTFNVNGYLVTKKMVVTQ